MKNEQRNYWKKCNKMNYIHSLSFGRNKIYRQINLINQYESVAKCIMDSNGCIKRTQKIHPSWKSF
ncbi:hypothetical protein GsuE55_28230 [Geobacillus subterraneus]|uniref:Uncharacterized protein n=1 Tax=Geobacillus subterraneus TaxID=129338 RepID=A0A679FPN4_9BACL|nr:hypothetical protein GsuE55_28230 [Geobacillus subterraneus]